MNYQHISLSRKLLIVLKYALIILLTFSLTLIIPTSTNAQIFNSTSESKSEFTPWWELNKTRVCGKLRCSDISFPYFPYAGINNQFSFGNSFTIASRTNLENPQATTTELEIRANIIEQTWLSIFKKIVRNLDNISSAQELYQLSQLNIKPEDWLIFQDKPLQHPLTPRIEVGIRDRNTVIFIPEQPELGILAQTIVTVTESDSLYNGKPIDKLAEQWRKIIQLDLSNALWGYEFDRHYPWARLIVVSVILILTILPLILITIVNRFIRKLDFQLKIKIREMHKLAKQNINTSFFKKSNVDEISVLNLASERENIIDKDQDENYFTKEEIINNFKTNSMESKFDFIKGINIFFNYIHKFILTRINNLTTDLPIVSLAYQNIIKQLKNLTNFLRRLVFWLRFLILFIGLALVFCVYPNTRTIAFFFLVQAILLPIIWMLVNLGHTISCFIIDYYLNRWATEAQLTDPNSNRYTLRLTTYSPSLKGASSFLFIVIGIVLTIQLFGIDTSVLAGAGGAALFVGFLARNVLEDMLNGALILWTDRYAIGDIIQVGTVGGFVENMNLYNTQIRGAEGRLITIPNGQITLVENKTKDWSRVEFKIEISTNSDPIKAIEILKQIGQELQNDPDWQELILEPVNILGIDQVSHQGILIQVWIITQPMKQWSVGREYRLRVQQRFKFEGIELGIPQRQISNSI